MANAEYVALLVGFIMGCVVTWVTVFTFQFLWMESRLRAEDLEELGRLRNERHEQMEMAKQVARPRRTMLD